VLHTLHNYGIARVLNRVPANASVSSWRLHVTTAPSAV